MTVQDFNKLLPGSVVKMKVNKCGSDFKAGDTLVLVSFDSFDHIEQAFTNAIFRRVNEEVPVCPYVCHTEL